VQDSQKLIPSVTKVFRKNQNLYVYLEVYEPIPDPTDKRPSVVAALSIFRGNLKAFESEPVRVTGLGEHRATMPIQFRVPLNKLRAGQYTCQLNIIDEVGHKFAYRRSPLVLLP
jgi:hypothetical protein